MKSVSSTPSSAQKPKRSHLGEFLPLYKKSGDSKAELNKSSQTSDQNDLSASKIQSRSPKHQLPSNKHQVKRAMDISLITIDGTSLNGSDGNSTPLNETRVTSTPVASKKLGKADKKLKKTPSADSMTVDNDVSFTTKSQKRSKSVSFLIEDNDNNQTIIKKTKSNDAQDTSIGDTLQKLKKNKKNKAEKENNDEEFQDVESTTTEVKKKKLKSVHKSGTEEPVQSIPVKNKQGDSAVNNKKLKKQSKEEKHDKLTELIPEKTKKAKKHQHIDEESEGEPAPKSPKTEFIDNLENLNLGDNTHTLTNLIDEMAVVDKAKRKKLKKTANRDKKQNETDNQIKNEIKDEKQEQTEDNENEKKTWDVKRWNKHKKAEKARNTTVNVDNLPASLLKGNFKKVLIDHFSKYGIPKGVGEAVIQNEGEPNPVFTTKVYFDTAEAAVQALELDGTNLAGNQIRVSAMRPITETNLVIRIYGHPDKLTDKAVLAAFGDVGLIRSIKPLRNKKTMTTAFVEFEGPEEVKRALKKSTTLTISGKKVMANPYTIRTFELNNHLKVKNHDENEKKDHKNDGKKKRRRRGANKAQRGPKDVKLDNDNK